MSNFICEECGAPILEGEDGHYITGCEHYPQDETDMPTKPKEEQLAENHWKWLSQLFYMAGIKELPMSAVAYLYKTAFVHGWKHAKEDKQ